MGRTNENYTAVGTVGAGRHGDFPVLWDEETKFDCVEIMFELG